MERGGQQANRMRNIHEWAEKVALQSQEPQFEVDIEKKSHLDASEQINMIKFITKEY